MTREEFLRLCSEAGFEVHPWGVIQSNGTYRYVLPCQCGETICEGWAMIYPENLEQHLQTLAWPDENTP